MRILLLADIHIGSIKDINYVYNVTTDIIEKELLFQKTDLVVILGDYFDKLFKSNETYIGLAINLMAYLVRCCKRNHTKLRMIYGTESHDMTQYQIFNSYIMADDIDLKIFDTVTEEETFPGVSILYIPEEYMFNKREFYAKYLYAGKHYNYIFGHGIIEDGLPTNMILNLAIPKSEEKQVPRFKSGEFSSIADITVFGHYHSYTDMGNQVYYLGSLFRNCFGEETPKGYGIIEDKSFTFIENQEAYVFKTYKFDVSSDVYKSPKHVVNEIKRIKEENPEIFSNKKYGRIQLSFHIPENISDTFKESLRSLLFNEKLITIDIEETSKYQKEEDQKEEIDDTLEFVLDNSLCIFDKMHQYIGKILEYPMSLKELTSYIKDPLNIK